MNEEFSFEVEPFEFETNNGEWESEVNRSRRGYIKWVQRSLNQILGLQLAVDGISAAQTRSAIRSFQQQRGLTVDGRVGSQTERALITAGAANPPDMVSPPPAASRPLPGASPATGWVLPPAVQAAGERQSVRYDRPPSWDNGRNCTGSFSAGAAELRDYIRAAFRGISSIGGYNCRQNSANRAETSVHGAGRALDIMISPVNGHANGAVGDPIANWLVQNAQAVGIQYIIWDRTRWSGSRSGRKDGIYDGPNPHIDHIHVELNRDGASSATPWFSSRARNTGTDENRAGEVDYEGFDQSALPASVRDLFGRGAVLWPAAVQRAIEAGMRDLNQLTNIVFFMHHPERIQGGVGKPIHPSEPGYSKLADEWKAWRDLVKPILAKAPAPPPAPGKSPAGSLAPVNTPMPGRPGFETSGTQHKYGVPETIEALKTIAYEWKQRHPDIRFMVRDISRQGGGQLSPHASHRVGLDADVQLWIDKQKVCMANPNYAIWRPYVQELVSVIRGNPILEVKAIGFSDRQIKNVSYWSGHTCHLHIRFCMPAGYDSQLDLNRVYKPSEKKPSYQC